MQTFESNSEDLYPSNEESFEKIALNLFHRQAESNPVYKAYLTALGVERSAIQRIGDIPFLPVTFFKTHQVITGDWKPESIFTSSGTTGQEVSRHLIPSVSFYLRHSQKIFEETFGPLTEWHVLCLLPSYLERTGSSLVKMADHFIKESKSPFSGFYLNNLDRLANQLLELKGKGKVLLLGVSFALVDLAEQFELDLSHCTVMETGGMKGRRLEIIREELHEILRKNLNISVVYSEYGMTELLSQAYSTGEGIYRCPASMALVIKEINDPFGTDYHTSGRINIVDLANVHSCAFIETQDLGRIRQNRHFEVLGRLDNSDVRGCNLMVN